MKEQTLINTLQKLMDAPISLDQFYSLYDDAWENNEFLNAVVENIEDTLEHVSGNLFSGRIDIQNYKASNGYQIMKIDLKLLSDSVTEDSETMLTKRNDLIRKL